MWPKIRAVDVCPSMGSSFLGSRDFPAWFSNLALRPAELVTSTSCNAEMIFLVRGGPRMVFSHCNGSRYSRLISGMSDFNGQTRPKKSWEVNETCLKEASGQEAIREGVTLFGRAVAPTCCRNGVEEPLEPIGLGSRKAQRRIQGCTKWLCPWETVCTSFFGAGVS